MHHHSSILLTFLLLLTTAVTPNNGQQRQHHHDDECSRIEHERCVRIADPLVREAHLVLPDNPRDIDIVCHTWTAFVDCLKQYTERCFTEQQRRQFNKAVETPIESVHQMCMEPQYQKEYLQYAPCIKATIVDRNRCGPHYSLLVEQVAQGEIISKATLCCSHDRFKQCVNRETRRSCDRDVQSGPAAMFSSQILDKALSFLQDQCFNYIPNSGDCTSVNAEMSVFGTMQSTSQWSGNGRENYNNGGSSLRVNNNNSNNKETNAPQMPRMATPKQSLRPSSSSSSATSWMPETSATNRNEENAYQTDSSTQVLGSRTRPASYGRSSSSTNNNNKQSQQIGANTVQQQSVYEPEVAVTTQRAQGTQWASSTWSNLPHNVVSTQTSDRIEEIMAATETWYPAAGNQLSNEVDEPNQQGLKYNANRNNNGGSSSCSVNFIANSLAVFMILLLKW